MASPSTNSISPAEGTASDPSDIPRALAGQIQPVQSPPPSSTPVEMSKFGINSPGETGVIPSSPSEISPENLRTTREGYGFDVNHQASTPNPESQVSSAVTNTSPSLAANPTCPPPNPLTREKTAPAIGPSSDKPTLISKESDIMGPILMITLLLTNGARHPYKIDEKYLKKRSVKVEGNNPINMSTYTLKELIWREWREEWETRPSSPSSIRLIYYGKLLDDKARLHDCKFVVGPTTHVVHMTIKPQEIVDEEDAKMAKSGSRDRDGNDRSPGCRCVIL
ncbi:hypothetical protein MMC07_002104 [Pseudocyphellaria aurata]|nr:hypothetical protein [Pseudocyphellaria aurata]